MSVKIPILIVAPPPAFELGQVVAGGTRFLSSTMSTQIRKNWTAVPTGPWRASVRREV